MPSFGELCEDHCGLLRFFKHIKYSRELDTSFPSCKELRVHQILAHTRRASQHVDDGQWLLTSTEFGEELLFQSFVIPLSIRCKRDGPHAPGDLGEPRPHLLSRPPQHERREFPSQQLRLSCAGDLKTSEMLGRGGDMHPEKSPVAPVDIGIKPSQDGP